MKASAPLVLALLAAGSPARGAAATVRYKDHNLVEARSLSALPREVRNLFDRDGGMADRGGAFNSSDVVRKGVPMRRFAVAGVAPGFALIAVEHGGFAYRVEVHEFTKTDGKWTMGPLEVVPKRPADLAALVQMLSPEPEKPETGTRAPTIFYSAAPWDGAAYDLEIPLEKTDDAPNPSIRVNLWGNPRFDKPETVHFTGKEDAGGGPGRGAGRASYQAIKDKSRPENLAGTVVFDVLKAGQPVTGRYDLTTEKGKKFEGRFKADWGNRPERVIR